jgi:lipopolysaccharide/colanic/teichoic acid biosynthesis glycosyltransferase
MQKIIGVDTVISSERNRDTYFTVIKPALDYFVAAALLVITSPLFLIFCLSIKLHSPGPIFFTQERVGKYGKPFRIFKFRSMRVNADTNFHREYMQQVIQSNISPADLGKKSLKLDATDPRITHVGKVLRSSGLDELPQLINVLRGEMSIVGPRPPIPYEVEIYEAWHKQRLAVLPGITGLWQVTAHNLVPFDEMVRIDIDYIQKANLWLDLKIMLLTPLEMLRKKG